MLETSKPRKGTETRHIRAVMATSAALETSKPRKGTETHESICITHEYFLKYVRNIKAPEGDGNGLPTDCIIVVIESLETSKPRKGTETRFYLPLMRRSLLSVRNIKAPEGDGN